MDKNTITGLVLIFLIFIGFSIFNSSRLNKTYEKVIVTADSLYSEGDLENARAEYINALRYKPNSQDAIARVNEINQTLGFVQELPSADTVTSVVKSPDTSSLILPDSILNVNRFGTFAASATGVDEYITLENNRIELKISLRGGRVYSARLKDFVTHDGKPLILFSGDSTEFGFNFFTADNRAIRTNDLWFTRVTDSKVVSTTESAGSVVLRLLAGDDRYIEYNYTLEPDKYTVDFNVTFKSMEGVIASNVNSITLDWKMYIPQQEKGRQNEDLYTTIKYRYYQDDVDGLNPRSKKELDNADITTKLSWVAFQDQFFSSIVMTDGFFLNGSLSSSKTAASEKYIRFFTAELGVPFSQDQQTDFAMKFYYGPNHISTLKKSGDELDKIVFLGKNIIGWINRFIIIPIFNWLEKYIASYGLIILILTIIIKIVLLPLTLKSYQSTAKMQVLKPQVDELGKKFPKKEDAMKKQQATMELYKRAGVNPMGGCLPMLLQMPILFAMFRFFPVSIELRQEAFLWATDLSTYDSILTLPFTIPMYGNHVSLFTLLMTASTLLTMKMTGSSPGSDQPGMKAMMYMMPVMFMVILNNFSSGLTYYYFLANILTFIQNFVSKKMINADAVLAKLEENSKKPIKKSKWQQRLEEAAKQRGVSPPKR